MRALQLCAGNHARQLAVVAQVFEFGQRLKGGVDVASVEGVRERITWLRIMWSGRPTSRASGRYTFSRCSACLS